MADSKEIGFGIKLDGLPQAILEIKLLKEAAEDTFNSLSKGIDNIKNIFEVGLVKSIKAFSAEYITMDNIIKSSVIGFLVGILASLVTYVTQTSDGISQLTGIVQGLNVVLAPLKEVLEDVGRGLGVVVDWTLSLIPGFKNASDAARELEESQKALKLASVAFAGEQIEANKQINEDIRKSKDKNNTLQETLGFLKQASDAAEYALEREKALGDERLRLANEALNNAIAAGAGDAKLLELKLAVGEATNNNAAIEAHFHEQKVKAEEMSENAKETYAKKDEERDSKNAAKRKTELTEAEQKANFLNNLNDQVADHTGTAEERATAKIQQEYNKRIEEAKKLGLSKEQFKQAEVDADKIRTAELYDLDWKLMLSEGEIDDKQYKDKETKEKEDQAELKRIKQQTLSDDKDFYDAQKADLDGQLLAGQITKRQYQTQDRQNQLDEIQNELSVANLSADEKNKLLLKEAELKKKFYDEDVKASAEAEKKKIEAANKTLKDIGDALGTITKAVDADYKAQEDSVKSRYDTEIKAAGANTAQGLKLKQQEVEEENKLKQAQFNTDKDLALVKGAIQIATAILGQIPDPIGIALAAAAGAVELGVIAASKFQPEAVPSASVSGSKYAQGGLIDGPSHMNGGVMANVEGGEAIINKNSTAMYKGLLSSINSAGGGKSFDKIGEKDLQNSNSPNITKTYVISSEVSSSQEAAKRIQRLSRL